MRARGRRRYRVGIRAGGVCGADGGRSGRRAPIRCGPQGSRAGRSFRRGLADARRPGRARRSALPWRGGGLEPDLRRQPPDRTVARRRAAGRGDPRRFGHSGCRARRRCGPLRARHGDRLQRPDGNAGLPPRVRRVSAADVFSEGRHGPRAGCRRFGGSAARAGIPAARPNSADGRYAPRRGRCGWLGFCGTAPGGFRRYLDFHQFGLRRNQRGRGADLRTARSSAFEGERGAATVECHPGGRGGCRGDAGGSRFLAAQFQPVRARRAAGLFRRAPDFGRGRLGARNRARRLDRKRSDRQRTGQLGLFRRLREFGPDVGARPDVRVYFADRDRGGMRHRLPADGTVAFRGGRRRFAARRRAGRSRLAG